MPISILNYNLRQIWSVVKNAHTILPSPKNTKWYHNIVLTDRASLCRHITSSIAHNTEEWNEQCLTALYNVNCLLAQTLQHHVPFTALVALSNTSNQIYYWLQAPLAVQSLFHLKSQNRTINYSYTTRGATKLPTFAKLKALFSRATLPFAAKSAMMSYWWRMTADSLLF